MKGHPQEQAFLLELKYTRTYKGKACSGGPPSFDLRVLTSRAGPE